MRRIENLKDWIINKKLFVIAVLILVLIVTFIIIYFIYEKNDKKQDVNFDDEIIIEEDNLVENETANEVVKIVTEHEECFVYIDIKGAVVIPGLYKVSCDKRVKDVIDIAGGVTEKSDLSNINLSKKVKDEMVIIIPIKEEKIESNDTVLNGNKNNNNDKALNENKNDNTNNISENQKEIINDANISKDDLLPTIDEEEKEESKEEVAYPISINLATKDELMKIPGIGESKANNIIEYRDNNGSFSVIDDIKNVKGIGESIFESIKNYITI